MRRQLTVVFTMAPILLAQAAPVRPATAPQRTVYVWDFAVVGGATEELEPIRRDLTREFEEALIHSRCCTVLQRRQYARIFEQETNERAILSLGGVSQQARKELERLAADTVIFGDVLDDLDGGQLVVSVSAEAFSGEILDRGSVGFRRGMRFDRETRLEQMRRLVVALGWADPAPAPRMEPGTAQTTTSVPPPAVTAFPCAGRVKFESGGARPVYSTRSENAPATTVAEGTELTIYNKSGGWYYIKAHDQGTTQGFMLAAHVDASLCPQ